MIRIGYIASLVLLLTTGAGAAVFKVQFSDSLRSQPATGRLVLYLISDQSKIGPKVQPAGDYFFTDPQPIYGIDVKGLRPGQAARVDDSATAFPVKLSELPKGGYRVQAVLDMHRESGFWRREPGNLFSKVIRFKINDDPNQIVNVSLDQVVKPRPVPHMAGVDIVDIQSKLLSKFRGHSVHLHAGVVWPLDVIPGRKYAAVYVIPGFGGNHLGAFSVAEAFKNLPPNSPERKFHNNVFWIVLDPDGPNGHTLFANSDVNGPCGDALVRELIPAIESRFPLIRQPGARILRGHSSGGWAAIWLAIKYPKTFGACWAYSPDPIDFHRLERVDIYDSPNAYIDRDSTPAHIFDTSSFRIDGKSVCTVRIENRMEQAVGPDNTSAGQWDSWQSVWGRRQPDGNAAPLFDPITGRINRTEADYYKKHDIAELLRENPEQIGQIFQQRIRLIVGGADNFYLNEAVEQLNQVLQKLKIHTPPAEHFGYIKVIPGATHGSIMNTPTAKEFAKQVRLYLWQTGYLK